MCHDTVWTLLQTGVSVNIDRQAVLQYVRLSSLYPHGVNEYLAIRSEEELHR